jgi:hypothetical protein
MHIESAYPQSLMPRLAQHLVRRHNIQLVEHPATDQSTDDTADEAAHAGGNGHGELLCLRRLVATLRGNTAARTAAGSLAGACSLTGSCSAACTRTGAGSRIICWFTGVMSVWHRVQLLVIAIKF